MEFGLLIHIRAGTCTHFLVAYVWILWACRSHLTLGVLLHIFGSRNASYENPFTQMYKYYTFYEGVEEMYREQKEGRLLHSQFSLRPYST